MIIEIVFYFHKNWTLFHFSASLKIQLLHFETNILKFMFSKKATKIDEIFTNNLTLTK